MTQNQDDPNFKFSPYDLSEIAKLRNSAAHNGIESGNHQSNIRKLPFEPEKFNSAYDLSGKLKGSR